MAESRACATLESANNQEKHKGLSMTELNQRVADLENQLLRLQVHCQQLSQTQEAMNLVIAWLLYQHPRNEVSRFLCSHANDFESNPKFQEDVALLDHLRELLNLLDASREHPK